MWAVDDASADDNLNDRGMTRASRQLPTTSPIAVPRRTSRQAATAPAAVGFNRLRRAVTTQPPPVVELRMLVTQLHLDLLAGGVW